MINANELRIGNWLQSKLPVLVEGKKSGVDRLFVSVTAMPLGRTNSEWQIEAAFCDYDFNDLEPIPLTPEILEKCGWVTLDAESDIMTWGPEDDSFSISNNGGLDDERNQPYYFACDRNFIELKREIKYLHQLQNLYFALTGEELPVNLSE